MIVVSASGGSGNYGIYLHYQGYNINSQVNLLAVWPGTYRATIVDKSNNCQLIIEDITVGKLDAGCHDGVTNFIPSQTWNNDVMVNKNVITYYELGNSNTTHTIYNDTISDGGFIVDNLIPHTTNYDIEIFKWNGSTYVSQVSGSSVITLHSGAQVAGKYYVEIRKKGETCDDIGFLFDYTGTAKP